MSNHQILQKVSSIYCLHMLMLNPMLVPRMLNDPVKMWIPTFISQGQSVWPRQIPFRNQDHFGTLAEQNYTCQCWTQCLHQSCQTIQWKCQFSFFNFVLFFWRKKSAKTITVDFKNFHSKTLSNFLYIFPFLVLSIL